MIIIHAVNKQEFEKEMNDNGYYGIESLKRCGFIHCSEISTYHFVAPIFKDDKDEKVIVVIDSDKLTSPLKWEKSDNIAFPHIYGYLNKEAIIEVLPHLWSDKKEWIVNQELNKYIN